MCVFSLFLLNNIPVLAIHVNNLFIIQNNIYHFLLSISICHSIICIFTFNILIYLCMNATFFILFTPQIESN